MTPREEAPTVIQAAPDAVTRRHRGLLAMSGRRGRLARGGTIRVVLAGLGAFLVAFGLLLRFYAAPRLISAPADFYLMVSLADPHASYFDESALITRHD